MLSTKSFFSCFLAVLSVYCIGIFATNEENGTNGSGVLQMVMDKLSTLEQRETEQSTMIENLQSQITDQHDTIQQLSTNLKDHQDTNILLQATISSQQTAIEKLEHQLAVFENTYSIEKAEPPKNTTPKPESRDQYQALGCFNDTIDLSCPNGGLINVTRAYYGLYLQNTACSVGCCAPNPGMDCTETVEENDSEDWTNLKNSCDNKTDCSYVYDGATINECETAYVADYMLIYYSCLAGDDNILIAFTSRAATDRFYAMEDIVLFDLLLTNSGNHYSRETSAFICPFHGIYSFSVSFYAGVYNDMAIDLMRDNESVISVYADYDSSVSGLSLHGMSSVVVECAMGQIVWVRCYGAGYMRGGSYLDSHFTGFMLQRFS